MEDIRDEVLIKLRAQHREITSQLNGVNVIIDTVDSIAGFTHDVDGVLSNIYTHRLQQGRSVDVIVATFLEILKSFISSLMSQNARLESFALLLCQVPVPSDVGCVRFIIAVRFASS